MGGQAVGENQPPKGIGETPRSGWGLAKTGPCGLAAWVSGPAALRSLCRAGRCLPRRMQRWGFDDCTRPTRGARGRGYEWDRGLGDQPHSNTETDRKKRKRCTQGRDFYAKLKFLLTQPSDIL